MNKKNQKINRQQTESDTKQSISGSVESTTKNNSIDNQLEGGSDKNKNDRKERAKLIKSTSA